ncbi:MAG: hypothetical protein JWQ63_2401 [Mucilaginibacter sp.]|jgi:hypothetical protein|nr:hypothetical protein [Mucilaginibacter sp.]
MKNYAVLTGDIINFTQLSNNTRQSLIEETRRLIKSWVKIPGDAEIFRGDSYQLIFNDIEKALKRSIQLICWFKKYPDHEEGWLLSTRISVGIGKVAYKGKSVLDSDGEAFHQSGRSFDKMNKDDLLTISSDNKEINEQIAIILIFINLIISQWTVGQAEVIYLYEEGYTQQKMAEKLGIRQGAVNNRLRVAKWKEVEKGINYISSLLKQS